MELLYIFFTIVILSWKTSQQKSGGTWNEKAFVKTHEIWLGGMELPIHFNKFCPKAKICKNKRYCSWERDKARDYSRSFLWYNLKQHLPLQGKEAWFRCLIPRQAALFLFRSKADIRLTLEQGRQYRKNWMLIWIWTFSCVSVEKKFQLC